MSGSGTLAPAGTAPATGTAAGRRRGPAPPGERGRLSIDPRVVQKIATAAAMEVDHVGGAARRVLNMALGSDESAGRPQVDARVDGATITVQVLCSVAYPAPVADVTERLRSHVIERIDALTGLQTRQVDIIVSALTTVRAPTRRELE